MSVPGQVAPQLQGTTQLQEATQLQGTIWSRDENAAAFVEVCSVRVGETLFGVPVHHILEIVGSVRPLPVQRSPGFIGGVVHYRGDVLAAVNLRFLLGLPRGVSAQDVLVIGGEGGRFGLLVDSVSEVLTVAQADFEPDSSILDESYGALLKGAYKLNGRRLVMLDPERLDPLRLGAGRNPGSGIEEQGTAERQE